MITPRWVVLGAIAIAAYVMMPRPASAGYPACPTGGAPLDLFVDNETGARQTVTFTGTLKLQSCGGTGFLTTYSVQASCPAGNPGTPCTTVTGLESGIWMHQISVGSQQQGTQSVLIGNDPGGVNNSVSWTAFKTVITVDNTVDGTGNCSQAGHCTLRQAIANANTAPSPALVQFSSTVFPTGTQTTVTLSQPPPADITISGYKMVVDGKDLNGNPAFVANPTSSPAFNRVVELPSSGSSFVFSGQLATLSGLFIQRPTQATGATPGVPVFFGASSTQNTVANVKVDGGGSSVTGKSPGQDCKFTTT